jgi:hypothetical protein
MSGGDRIRVGRVSIGCAPWSPYRRERNRSLSHRRLGRAAAGDDVSVRATRTNSESFNRNVGCRFAQKGPLFVLKRDQWSRKGASTPVLAPIAPKGTSQDLKKGPPRCILGCRSPSLFYEGQQHNSCRLDQVRCERIQPETCNQRQAGGSRRRLLYLGPKAISFAQTG